MNRTFITDPTLNSLASIFDREPVITNVNRVLDIKRQNTAAASVQTFFRIVGQGNKEPNVVTTSGVGLRLGGISACYDLYWFPHSDRIYAIHGRDVFTLSP